MNFNIKTTYNPKTIKVMVKALRKTVRKKRNIFVRIFGSLVIIFGTTLFISEYNSLNMITTNMSITLISVIAILCVLLWEDSINAYLAYKRMMSAMAEVETTFRDENYEIVTKLGTTQFNYDIVNEVTFLDPYIVFIFDFRHAQVFDISKLDENDKEELKKLIELKTNKKIKVIK